MRWVQAAISCGLMLWTIIATSHSAEPQTVADDRIVTMDGYSVRVHIRGLETRRPGQPVVVFEAGATNSLEVWHSVLPEVVGAAPVIAYDRAGLGKSEWDGATPTPRHVAARLRRLLELVGARPPYVLVGYSWGGMLVRYFTGYHAEEVAGLVLVDPGPMVGLPLAERLAPFDAIGAGRAGYDAYWSNFGALGAQAAPAVRAEFDVFRRLMERDTADPDLGPLPAVPLVVIVAAKYLPLRGMKLPYDPQAHFEADVRHRTRMLQEWVLSSRRGSLVVSNHTTHAVLREDPELVVWAVRRVLSALTDPPR